MYPKCNETKCTWHMGNGFTNYTYLNGTCYHSNGKENMFCPLNKNITAYCECTKPLSNLIDNSNKCHRCNGIILIKTKRG